MTTAKATTITVNPKRLATALRQVIKFAGDDGTLPVIRSINFEVRGDLLTLTATDRYVLGHARIPFEGVDAEADHILVRDHVAHILALLRSREMKNVPGVDLTFRPAAEGHTTSWLDVSGGATHVGLSLPGIDGTYPSTDALLGKAIKTIDAAGLAPSSSFNPAHVGRVMDAFALSNRHEPIRICAPIQDAGEGVHIAYRPGGDRDLIGLLMPVRWRDGDQSLTDVWGSIFPVESQTAIPEPAEAKSAKAS